MEIADLPLAKLYRRLDARSIVQSAVAPLAKSIAEVGVLNPIRVRPVERYIGGALAQAWEITAGAHRFEAARVAGLQTVPCIIVSDDDLRAELVMLDENLCRAELSPADRAAQTARRKEIYETLHPEARAGAAQAAGMNAVLGRGRQLGDDVNRFTAETARATGQSERKVQRDAERGEKVADDVLAQIAGTRLDKGSYLDLLKGMSKAEQRAKVAEDLAIVNSGEPTSVAALARVRKPVGPSDPPRNEFELINAEHRALVRAWESARPEARERFLTDIGAVIDTPVMDRRFA